MQASDELRCSGMTIGAFSFSDDGGSERRAAAPAYQTATEKRPGQWRRKVSNVHTLFR